MSVHAICLNIPTSIERGLLNGTMARNAAGIIRATSLHPERRAGTILGHLREVNGPSQGDGSLAFMPGAATVALQTATLTYLKVRLDRMENQLDAIHRQGSEILSNVTRLKELQYLEFAEPAAEALELLHRYGHGQRLNLLEQAHVRFIQATGGVRHLLNAHSAEEMLENAPQVEGIFKAGALCAAGELDCLAVLEAPSTERGKALADHESLWRSIEDKLREVAPPSRRFPTVAMLRSSPERNPNLTRIRWLDGTSEIALAFQGEQAVLSGVQTISQKQLNEWIESANRGETRAIFVDAIP
jgi:hypothetical protein